MSVLSSLIYVEDLFSEGDTVYSAVRKYQLFDYKDGEAAMMSSDELQTLLYTVLNNKDIYDNMKIKNVKESGAGSDCDRNVAINYGDDLIVVYRGTAGPYEWNDNGEAAYSNVTLTTQQKSALAYYEKMRNMFGNNGNIYVTGHSKGGNKSQVVGILNDEVTGVYSFDGQGQGNAFLLQFKDEIERNRHKVINICNRYDYVNILLHSVAGQTYYTNTNIGLFDEFDIINNALAQHAPHTIYETRYNENGKPYYFLDIDENLTQSDLLEYADGLFDFLIDYMNEEDLKYFVHKIMHVMETQNDGMCYADDFIDEPPDGFYERIQVLADEYVKDHADTSNLTGKILNKFFGIGSYITGRVLAKNKASKNISSESYASILRDFTDEVKNNLQNITNDVDEEKWWDISKWDIWYRVEKQFGGLDFPRDSQNLNTYYRKLIDINGVTANEIQRIFDEVYEIQNQYYYDIKGANYAITEMNSKLRTLNERIKTSR